MVPEGARLLPWCRFDCNSLAAEFVAPARPAGSPAWTLASVSNSPVTRWALPASSPRIVTGRGALSLPASPITSVAGKAPSLRPAPSPRHYTGRSARQGDEGRRRLPQSAVWNGGNERWKSRKRQPS